MPWKASSPMQQRLAFVVEWSKHDTSMAELCRLFGISRQTGYELVAQFQRDGVDGLKPRSRAPHHHPNAIPEEVCAAVVRAKTKHPSFGPKKLTPLVGEAEHIKQRWPVASTRGAILARAGRELRTRAHRRGGSRREGSVRTKRDDKSAGNHFREKRGVEQGPGPLVIWRRAASGGRR